MGHLNEALSALLVIGMLGCATQHADGTAPETSRNAVDSAPPVDPSPDTDIGPAIEPLANLPPPAPRARPIVPPAFRPVPAGPYRVEVLGESSERLATFHHTGRTYVLGTIGGRYQIHVTNPTSRRVEAVVSVDGLDAIDGAPADYVHKSGYVIAPYGDVTIDGFRTSMDEVATFRFSSVRDSYAARTGAARNVGVIGVAFFAERDRPPPPPRPVSPPRDYVSPAASPPAASRGDDADGFRSLDESTAQSEASSAGHAAGGAARAPAAQPRRERAGLGTEFGEQRSSVVENVEFQRADAAHPVAVAELRYNDRDGLIALGIPLRAPPPSELELRETASPFPANRFASAPPPR